MHDRVGLGWRAPLAPALLGRLDAIDVFEVLAEDWIDAPRRRLRALRGLAAQVPLVLHGTRMGLASCLPVPVARLDEMARLVEAVQPERWSEHLAFVRAGGREIGHLAAPPRDGDTVSGTAENVERARRVVGSSPLLENVATLVEPPGDRSEADWVAQAVTTADVGLLLDLHNLHANASNFGFDAREFLDRVPLHRIEMIHIAGGRWITDDEGTPRLIDDHRHDVPDPVFGLLEEVAARAPQPLTVVLERDGRYPPVAMLLAEIARARRALAAGRARRIGRSA